MDLAAAADNRVGRRSGLDGAGAERGWVRVIAVEEVSREVFSSWSVIVLLLLLSGGKRWGRLVRLVFYCGRGPATMVMEEFEDSKDIRW